MSSVPWQALPHRPLEQLSARVWRLEGDLPNMALKRVMTVVRRDDGSLLLHSPIAADAPAMAAIDGLGPVSAILVPNGYHRMDSAVFASRYPEAKVVCPRSAKARVSSLCRVDAVYEEFDPGAGIALTMVAGTAGGEGALTVTEPSGTTLIFNDALFNMPHAPGFGGFITRYITGSSGGPKVSRVGKMLLVKNKQDFSEALKQFASVPSLTTIVVSHHEVIRENCADVLRNVATDVLR